MKRHQGGHPGDVCILEAAIASPDIGHSTFGNQMAMMIRGMAGGRATREALAAQARWGLRTAQLDPAHPDGPNRLRAGALVDEVLQREHPMEWWRQHILGPQGVLRRMGLDPLRSSPARIAEALAPMFSNVSAENIANMFSTQQAEWQNQIRRAMALNRGRPMWERGPLDDAADQSLWTPPAACPRLARERRDGGCRQFHRHPDTGVGQVG